MIGWEIRAANTSILCIKFNMNQLSREVCGPLYQVQFESVKQKSLWSAVSIIFLISETKVLHH